jgi:thiol:disulfide interchange protein DsbC
MNQHTQTNKNTKLAEILKHKKWLLLAILFLTTFFIFVYSFTLFAKNENNKPSPETVKQDLQKMLPRFSIAEVNNSPIPGIYEIVGESGQIIYYNPKGYIIFGEIWSINGTSITAERRMSLQEKRLSKVLENLPLDKALKIGNGPKTIIEVSDPTCPFCRRAHEALKKHENLTKYVFFLPIHGEASLKAISYIVCSNNPATKYDEAYSGKVDDQIGEFQPTPECQKKVETLLEEHIKVAQTLQVRGTPYFVIDKKPIEGANLPLIEKLLNGKK